MQWLQIFLADIFKSQVCPRPPKSDPCGSVTTSTTSPQMSDDNILLFLCYFYCFCGDNLFINIEQGSSATESCDWRCSRWQLLLSLFETFHWIVLLALCSCPLVENGAPFATFPLLEVDWPQLQSRIGKIANTPQTANRTTRLQPWQLPKKGK